MPTFLILFISIIARYVMYYLDVIFRFVTTYIAAQLSIKIITLLHPSSSYAIQRASSIPTSLAKYTIDYILSPRYLLFPLPAPRHYTTVPTQPQILLLSMQIIAQYMFRFAFPTTFQYSRITPSFKLVTYISSSSYYGLARFIIMGLISSPSYPIRGFLIIHYYLISYSGVFFLLPILIILS